MKATGIVRRIDDLGRVVIPKEIRRVMHIKEGSPLEIFTDKNGEIVLKKYSPMGELGMFAQQYADSLAQYLNCVACVSDHDQIIAVAGGAKRELLGKSIHHELEKLIDNRDAVMANKGEKGYVEIADEVETEYTGEVIQTIICEGDAIGAIVILTKDADRRLGEAEQKAAFIAASFLGKQMEC